MFVSSKDDEVIVQSVAGCQQLDLHAVVAIERWTYRMSKRL